MKRYFIALGLVCLAAAPATFAQEPATSAREKSLLARVTVYWANGGGGSDQWTRKHQAATSVRLRAGHCAVDPRHIPYGSQVVLPDATLEAVDTGKHVVNRKAARLAGRTAAECNALVIDRFFETKEQALAWAGAHPHFMSVQVRPPEIPATPSESRLLASNSGIPPIARITPTRASLLHSADLP